MPGFKLIHVSNIGKAISWWRHQMETYSALLAIFAGNSPVTSEFPAQRPVTRSFNVFSDLTWINGWVNNRKAGDLKRHHTNYDVTVMCVVKFPLAQSNWPASHCFTVCLPHRLWRLRKSLPLASETWSHDVLQASQNPKNIDQLITSRTKWQPFWQTKLSNAVS